MFWLSTLCVVYVMQADYGTVNISDFNFPSHITFQVQRFPLELLDTLYCTLTLCTRFDDCYNTIIIYYACLTRKLSEVVTTANLQII